MLFIPVWMLVVATLGFLVTGMVGVISLLTYREGKRKVFIEDKKISAKEQKDAIDRAVEDERNRLKDKQTLDEHLTRQDEALTEHIEVCNSRNQEFVDSYVKTSRALERVDSRLSRIEKHAGLSTPRARKDG